MAKETKKQIKAQIINEIAKQFHSRIKNLEFRLNAQIQMNLDLHKKNDDLRIENLKLKEQLEKYEDWNQRLQEFMDMDTECREEVIKQYRTSKELNERFNGILNMYERMFRMF